MRLTQFLLTAAVLATSTVARAEDEAICADRPGKATATCIVPKGAWQVETGLVDWSLQRTQGRTDTTLVLGDTVVKYGLSESTDIGIDLTPYVRTSSHDHGISERADGMGDLSLQLKHRLTDDSSPFQVTLLPIVTAPTANHSVGVGHWQFAMLVPIDYQIPRSTLSVAMTPEVDWVPDADGHGLHLAAAQVAALSWQSSDRLNLTAELWGQWDWDPTGTTRQASVDGSVAYLLSRQVQLDAGVNLGLNGHTPDVELYGGFAVRF